MHSIANFYRKCNHGSQTSRICFEQSHWCHLLWPIVLENVTLETCFNELVQKGDYLRKKEKQDIYVNYIKKEISLPKPEM